MSTETPRRGLTWAQLAVPGLRQWRCGMQKEAVLVSFATVGAAAGAALVPWTTWDSFVVGLMCFRAVLGLYAGNALSVASSWRSLPWLVLLPERELPRRAGPTRALVPLALLAALTGWLGYARSTTRVFPEAATLEPTPQGATWRNEANAMSMHLPPSWTVNHAVAWPTLMTARNPDGTCQARVLLTYAPPLPDALDGFYVQRMMTHHLGVHTVEAQDRMFVSMWPTRQFVVDGGGGESVFTAVQRGDAWVVLQLSSVGEVGACAMDFSRIRSSWMVW